MLQSARSNMDGWQNSLFNVWLICFDEHFPSIKWSVKHSVTGDAKKLKRSQVVFQVMVREIPMSHLFFKESPTLPILSSSRLSHSYHLHFFYPLLSLSLLLGCHPNRLAFLNGRQPLWVVSRYSAEPAASQKNMNQKSRMKQKMKELVKLKEGRPGVPGQRSKGTE